MKLLVVLALCGAVYGRQVFQVREECQGYSACHPIDSNKLNVHLMPHSHDDVGWLSTVDQYFYNQVETIISSVVGGLLQNEDRRFIQVETAFFNKWWLEQNDLTKDLVKQLINDGRLELIGGAWSMNDEAASHYHSTIDQFTLGLRYLQDNLGQCARVKAGWQIDPFGHSREQASLFSQLGYDSFFFARLDYRDRDKRKAEGNLDLLWTGSANLGAESTVLTSAFEGHYSAPGGFCFDIRCGDELINPDPESPDYNLDKRVNDFVGKINETRHYYPTSNMLYTLGDDFKWEAAERSFNNVDKLIAGFKKLNPKIDGKEINIIYSTPSCYAKAVNDEVTKNSIKLDTKTDDFFPYASSVNRVWAGYFTSRPTSKRNERIGNNFLQVSRQLTTLGDIAKGALFPLESAMGRMQHHDAITGTEKAHVEKDYHRFLTIGMDKALEADSQALTNILGASKDVGLKSCPLANVSICAESQKDEFNVLLYNPLAKSTSTYVQIPVTGESWTVTDPDGKSVEVAVSVPIRSFDDVANATGGKLHSNVLIFKASLPALGYNVYNIKKSTKQVRKTARPALGADQKVGFDDKYVTLDEKSGKVKSLTLNNVTIDLEQEIQWYLSSDASGAYIFRPDSGDREPHSFGDTVKNTVLVSDGDVVREIKQEFNDWNTQIIRIFKDEDYIEFDYAVGPIELDDAIGKEIVLKYKTSLDTDSDFYTDSNGRELLRRVRDFYPTFDYSSEEPQAGNYYPVNTRIAIEDKEKRFAVITDRSHGGSSLHNGEVEVMVNRALTHDDGYGVEEPLNEQEFDKGLVSRGSNFISLGSVPGLVTESKTVLARERQIVQRTTLRPWVFFPTETIATKSASFLTKELPENVQLLTLDKWNDDDGTILIRLEHILEQDEDTNLSKDVSVDLTGLIKGITITSLEETLLSGTVKLADSDRLVWPQLNTEVKSKNLLKSTRLERAADDLTVTLSPMQIRTFIAKITRA